MRKFALLLLTLTFIGCLKTKTSIVKQKERTIKEQVELLIQNIKNEEVLIDSISAIYENSRTKEIIYANKIYNWTDDENLELFDTYCYTRAYYDSLIKELYSFDTKLEHKINLIRKNAENYISSYRTFYLKNYYENGIRPGGDEYFFLYDIKDSLFIDLLIKIVKDDKFVDCDEIIVDLYNINPKLLPDSIVNKIDRYRTN